MSRKRANDMYDLIRATYKPGEEVVDPEHVQFMREVARLSGYTEGELTFPHIVTRHVGVSFAWHRVADGETALVPYAYVQGNKERLADLYHAMGWEYAARRVNPQQRRWKESTGSERVFKPEVDLKMVEALTDLVEDAQGLGDALDQAIGAVVIAQTVLARVTALLPNVSARKTLTGAVSSLGRAHAAMDALRRASRDIRFPAGGFPYLDDASVPDQGSVTSGDGQEDAA